LDEYFAYIDEAGDEGFGKLCESKLGGQSNWLILGAIVVSKENDQKLPKWRDDIMTNFPDKRRKDLHFQKLKQEQKVAARREPAEKPFGVSVVCSDKSTIPGLRPDLLEIYKIKGHLYNYLVRFLLERITSACAAKSARSGKGAKLHVTFSNVAVQIIRSCEITCS
jgi:hypothetical protein